MWKKVISINKLKSKELFSNNKVTYIVEGYRVYYEKISSIYYYKHMLLALFLLEFVILQFAGLAPMLMFVLLCNMTMPLTLRVIYYYLPDYAGSTFGLAAVCLLPAWWFKEYFIPLPLMIMLQFILLFVGGYLLFDKLPLVGSSEE